jgi:hypothetical protein
LEGENVKRRTKRLNIGSERYIEGFYVPDRDDEACPHPATCLPDEDWRWTLRWTETDWVILEKIKTRNNDALYEINQFTTTLLTQKNAAPPPFLRTSITNA